MRKEPKFPLFYIYALLLRYVNSKKAWGVGIFESPPHKIKKSIDEKLYRFYQIAPQFIICSSA